MVEHAREAAARASCNLGGVALALRNYHSAHGALPPAVLYSPEGKPLHSWRVLILPYLEYGDLYREFRLDEPWDSDHNIRLLDRMPREFSAPWTRQVMVPPNHTVCRVFVGPGTPFEERGGKRLHADFPKGAADTLLFVEAGEPVPWTKPEGIPYDPGQPVRLQGLFRDGFRACAADGTYLFIKYDMDPQTLHALIAP
jgi:hypothetical protein